MNNKTDFCAFTKLPQNVNSSSSTFITMISEITYILQSAPTYLNKMMPTSSSALMIICSKFLMHENHMFSS